MSMTQWWKVASLLVVAGATVSGAGMLASHRATSLVTDPQATANHATGADVPVDESKEGKTNVKTVVKGSLGFSKREVVQSKVEGRTTIISILSVGTRVRKGDLVAELDSASLRDQLTNQRIAIQAALANCQNAKLTREVAEIAVKEYEEGIYPSERASIEGEIKLAGSANRRAEARLERTRRAQRKLTETPQRKEATKTSSDMLAELEIEDRIDSAEQELLTEAISLEKAQNKLHMLDGYTKPKTVKELRTEVEKARSIELQKQATWELEKNKEAKLERQIAACKIYAPADGVINSAMGEGTAIHERGSIMEILSSTP